MGHKTELSQLAVMFVVLLQAGHKTELSHQLAVMNDPHYIRPKPRSKLKKDAHAVRAPGQYAPPGGVGGAMGGHYDRQQLYGAAGQPGWAPGGVYQPQGVPAAGHMTSQPGYAPQQRLRKC